MKSNPVTPSKHPQIEKYLTLSTCHLPPDCGEWLPLFSTIKNEYGWIVSVDFAEYLDGVISDNIQHPELSHVLLYAIKNGCNMVWFDCDAPEVGDLPTWDW